MLEEAGILSHIEQLESICFEPQHIPAHPSDALAGTIVAIARDEAFSFAYAANIALLKDMGASICYFSPVHNGCIPQEADALWLPGGYPELHAKALSENSSMISSLKQFHKDCNPILAECSGFMYCMDALVDLDGNSWSMAGLIRGTGTMKNKAG